MNKAKQKLNIANRSFFNYLVQAKANFYDGRHNLTTHKLSSSLQFSCCIGWRSDHQT